jgi:hypothetical protein
MTGLGAGLVFALVAAAAFVLRGATAFLAARFLGVAAAFFPAARGLRVFAAFLAAVRDFRAFATFFAADFLEADFDAAMLLPLADPQVYRPGHCRQSIFKDPAAVRPIDVGARMPGRQGFAAWRRRHARA